MRCRIERALCTLRCLRGYAHPPSLSLPLVGVERPVDLRIVEIHGLGSAPAAVRVEVDRRNRVAAVVGLDGRVRLVPPAELAVVDDAGPRRQIAGARPDTG